MLVNLSGLVGYTGGYVLGNFSINKNKGELGTGVKAKIDDLKQGMKDYRVVLESGGRVIPGGYSGFEFAAKGLWDGERAPGRTWLVNGMGANVKTVEVPSPTGGRGKTMKLYMTPILLRKCPWNCLFLGCFTQ
jgi:hypothetical protein